ncbi:DUF5610 domain-containing protein [Marinicellulosiphila megalodicopiae]|uniref:DUF5610 domain-containing protein n=1 Tax=Marinicellulosiphila megalodicopiae TaxID=2724896 RepID=UPI003BB0B781
MISQLGHSNFSQHTGAPTFAHHDNHADIKSKTVEKQNALEKTDQTDVKEAQAISKTFDVDALVKDLYDQLASKVTLRSKGNEQEQEALWQQAKEGIAAGFAEAKDVLKSFGQMDDALNDKIDSAQGQLFERIDDQQSVREFNKIESSFEHKQQKSFALELTTKEGDQVRLLFDQSHHSKGRESASGLDLSQMDMDQFRLDVVGDLSEEELEDIKSLFKDVSELSQQFYKGNMDQAFDLARDLNINGSSLKSMDLNLSSYSSTTTRSSFGPSTAGAQIPQSQSAKHGIDQYKQMVPEQNKPVAMEQWLGFLEGFDKNLESAGLPKLGQWMEQANEANEKFMKIFDQASAQVWPSDIAKIDELF